MLYIIALMMVAFTVWHLVSTAFECFRDPIVATLEVLRLLVICWMITLVLTFLQHTIVLLSK